MEKIIRVFGITFGMVGLIVVLGFVLSYPLMLLWNGCLVPAVHGVQEVTWMQMWGLYFLFGFMFKSNSVSNSSSSG